MVAADVDARVVTALPSIEVVNLTVSDGETYTSVKFSTVTSAIASLNEDAGALSIPLSLAISGGEVTIHCTGLTDLKVCLMLFGN